MANLSSFQKTDNVDDVLAADYNRFLGGVLRAEFVNTQTISATLELADSDCQFQVITPSGANRTVELAPEATTNHVTIIYNAGATYSILVKDDSGATTYVTLAPDEWEIFLPVSGEGWKVQSWKTALAELPDETGWMPVSETWTRTGDHTFTVSTDLTSKYRKGTRVRYKQGGSYEYGVVKSSSYGAPNTTITLISNTDYAMAAGSLTDTYVSYFEQPEGFPYEFNFSAPLTNVTVGSGTLVQKFRAGFGLFYYYVEFGFESSGTPSTVTGDVAFTPPVAPLSYPSTYRVGVGHAVYFDAGVASISGVTVYDASGNLSARPQVVAGSYLNLVLTSGTVPFTWADGDGLVMAGVYKW